MKRHVAAPEAFYDKQIASISGLYLILNKQAPDEAKQGFAKSTAPWDGIKAFTLKGLPAAIGKARSSVGHAPE